MIVKFQIHRRKILVAVLFKSNPRFYSPLNNLKDHTQAHFIQNFVDTLHQEADEKPQVSILPPQEIQPILVCRNAPRSRFVPLLSCNHVEFIPFFLLFFGFHELQMQIIFMCIFSAYNQTCDVLEQPQEAGQGIVLT